MLLVASLALLAVVIGPGAGATPVWADVIVVNTISDADDSGDGRCSIHEAIIAANTDLPYADCPHPSVGLTADTIRFGRWHVQQGACTDSAGSGHHGDRYDPGARDVGILGLQRRDDGRDRRLADQRTDDHRGRGTG